MKYVLSLHQNSRLGVILLATSLIILWGSAAMAMTLNSPAFKQNGHIPSKYSSEDIEPRRHTGCKPAVAVNRIDKIEYN
jgi:hypothetical protein